MGDPFSDMVSPMVNAVMADVMSLIKQKYHLLQGLEKEMEKLVSKLSAIQAVLEDAEDKQLNSRPLKDWLGKLQEAANDAEDILETIAADALQWQKKNKHQVNVLRRASQKLDSANKIKRLTERFEEIAREKEQFHLMNMKDHSSGKSDDRNSNFNVNESDIVGRVDDKNQIVEMLLSEDLDKAVIIPIIGMGGLGKTTLAQLVYNDGRVESHFKSRMWVCVTDNFEYRRILKEMIEYHSKMQYDITLLSDSQLVSRLLEFLKGACFLLVLDDVWSESYEDWEKLKNIIEKGGKGCRVLVTSRTTRVSNVMGTHPPHLLQYLPDDQCWSLFEKIAFNQRRNLPGNDVRADLEDIGKKIVGKCKGLPLAVKAMGGLLRGNFDKNKWLKILQHDIWEAEEQNATTGGPIVLPALKLSYDHLPSHLKHCFAYCYIFPKAHVFHKTELVKIWKAASLIQPRGQDTADDIGCDYFDDMLTRSFFHISKVDDKEIYHMHDLIHDLAQSVSTPNCYQVKDNKKCQVSEKSHHVSLLCEDVEQPIMELVANSKKLRTLLSPTEYLKTYDHCLDKIFCTLKYVRVLDLSSSTMLELPKSVGGLKLLRYLDLSKNEIRELPNSICSLYNLQTLKLLGCPWLFHLPKDMANLVNLQHLELDEMFWHRLDMLPPRIGSINGLQNLHAFRVGRTDGFGIDQLGKMAYLKGRLHILMLENALSTAAGAKLNDKEALSKLVFEWSRRDGSQLDEEADEKILEHLQPHSNLQELQIIHYLGVRFPPWVRDGLVNNIVTFSLSHCTKCKSLPFRQLPNLAYVYIKGLLELEEWPEADYKSLRRIKISNCPKLRELPNRFLNLRVLTIKKCDSLKALAVTPSLEFLTLAENAVLEDWSEMICFAVVIDDQGQRQGVQIHSYIKLIELRIKNCPMLLGLPQVFAPQKLEISGCQLLTALPVPEFSKRFQHLALDARDDGTLLKAIPDTESLYSLVISRISGLISFPKLPRLPGLKALFISDCEELESFAGVENSFLGLNSLKLFSIRNCPKLVTFPEAGLPTALECLSIGFCRNLRSLGPNDVLKNLTSLKDLYIEHCPAVQTLPEPGLPTSLQHLLIKGCPPLSVQCQKDTGAYWPKIMCIPDLDVESNELSVPKPPKKSTWYRPTFSKGEASTSNRVP